MKNMIKRVVALAMLVAVFFVSKAITSAAIDTLYDSNVDFGKAEEIVKAMEAEGVTGRFIVRSTPFYSINANVPEDKDFGFTIFLDEEEWKQYAIAALVTFVVGGAAYATASAFSFKRHDEDFANDDQTELICDKNA